MRIIIVGGGNVAARKTQALLEAGASVIVISPQFCPKFHVLAKENPGLEMIQRTYRHGDLERANMVITATDSSEVNQAVWEEALDKKCLINVVDDPAHCNFILPAVVERGPIKVAITTGGSSPALARWLRERLETCIGPEYGELAQILNDLRPEIQERFASREQRLQAAQYLINSDLIEILRQKGIKAARIRADELLCLQEERNK